MTIIALNKPFRVISQFSASGDKTTLAAFVDRPGVYPAGRLDYDSEGLLLLTDDGRWQQRISDPRHKLPKTYLAQVEGAVEEQALAPLRAGLRLKDGPCRPVEARIVNEPALWPRQPPIRERRHIPTSWLELTLREGRNRQVRRMTAAIGHPTLRLVRWRIGPVDVAGLAPGEWRVLTPSEIEQLR